MPCFLPSLRNALIKVSGSWTVSETSFTPSMSCLRGLPQLSSDFFFVRSSSFKEDVLFFVSATMVFGGNYLPDFISYKKYMVGTDEDEDVFYGVCLTPNTDYIKIEIY